MDKIRHGASGVVESFSVHCHGHGLLMLRRIVSNCCLLNAFSSEWAAERTSPMSFVPGGVSHFFPQLLYGSRNLDVCGI